MRNATRRGALQLAALLAGGGSVRAQGLSTRPVTVIVPFSPGSPPDVVARIMAEQFARAWGQPFVVDNRVGASGNIGAQAASRAAPDGHTLMVSASTLVMNASLFRNLPYDPIASFAPVAELVTVGFGLLLHPSGGADQAEFVARAKAAPGRLNYASPGVGTPHHLAMELFAQRAGISLTHVPYRGVAGAVADLIAGQVAAMFTPISSAVELSRDGRVRLVSVANEARLPTVPSVPTVAEAGVPGMVMQDWYGLFAPAGTPPDILQRLNATANTILRREEVAALLTRQGLMPVGGDAERLRQDVSADLARWAEVVRAGNISAD